MNRKSVSRHLPALFFLAAFILPLGSLWADPPLVETTWVAANKHRPDVVLIDMTADDLQYVRYHIPGAVRMPYRALLKAKPGAGYPVRLDDRELYALLGGFGISAKSHVIIYDDMGGLEAGRLYWELERIGHIRVSVMNGGLVKWVLESREVDNNPITPKPVKYRETRQLDDKRENEADLADVLRTVQKKDALLLDTRTIEEYRGRPRRQRTGHVPGAILWSWDNAVNTSMGFRIHARAQLLKSLRKIGLYDKNQAVILYCQSGHRAAQTYWTLRVLGFNNVKLYPNSMNEYERIKTAPLHRGTRP